MPFNCNSNARALQKCLFLLNSCSSLTELLQVHAQIMVSGIHSDFCITDKIIQHCTSDSYRTANSEVPLHHALYVVKFSEDVDTFHWNKVIRAFATSNVVSEREALLVFLDMRRSGSKPNKHTFPILLTSCASFLGLNEGRQLQGDSVKHGLDSNVYVQNTLINLYGSCKKIMDAYKVFDKMTCRTIVSWNSIISATVECSWFYDSIELFVKMRGSGCEPDETAMVIMLSVCAELGSLSLGKWIHSQVIEKGMVLVCFLGTALVDMYGKCGDVNYASLVFSRMVYRNVWTWSAMILGFAQHGFARHALELFNEMKKSSIKPNHVTFLGVLCACSHAGMVELGQHYFNEMVQVHGIKPLMVNFGAMVDILGRAGCLEEAYTFVMSMPIKADGVVWRALLSACNTHDVNDFRGIGQKVRQKLIEMEPKRSGNLVMVANNYAEVGLWEKSALLRNRMRDGGLKKRAGESCLEIAGSILRFFSGDCSCIAAEDVMLLLNTLSLHSRMMKFE